MSQRERKQGRRNKDSRQRTREKGKRTREGGKELFVSEWDKGLPLDREDRHGPQENYNS